jgi:Domain of unknown function (DUF4440)
MTTPDNTHLKASLLEAEEARRQAMVDSNTQKLSALMADSMVYVHSSGITDSKPAYLQLLSSGTVTYETVAFDGLNIQLIGSVGLITGTMKASLMRSGNRKQIATAYLAVWEHVGGDWLLHAVQATSLPAAS